MTWRAVRLRVRIQTTDDDTRGNRGCPDEFPSREILRFHKPPIDRQRGQHSMVEGVEQD
jgi:hypothetical protein